MVRIKTSAIGHCEYFLYFIAVFLIIPLQMPSARDESGPLVLEHADRLISSGNNGEIVNLVGNVHFVHDKADLYSQRATWYRSAGLVQFADSVLVNDDERQITAQIVTYYRRDRRITALHDVEMSDAGQDVKLSCQRADYFRDSKRLEASGSTKLVLNSQSDSSRMVITALRMNYNADSAYGSAYDSVFITRHDLKASAGQADFYRNPEHLILTEKPVIVNEENELSGDTISLFTDNKKIQRVLVDRNARAIYRAFPDTALKELTTAELKGRQIEAHFANDKIETMVTRFNAVSLYKPAVTDTIIRGTNLASGDSITLFFKSGLIKRVYIQGGAQGEFIEPKLTPDGKAYFDTTHYSAGEIDYSFDNSEIKLYDNGQLGYQDILLNSGDIRYNTNTRILIAQGLGSDTAGDEIQLPILKQGTEELFGRKMSYNIDSRKGQVRMARTKYEGGFYTGKSLRQASEKELLVAQGNYTSCDKPDDPHYHFHSNRMKMINKNKVVARPVILYIGQLPIFAVPYYVFPIKKGRHSGFLPFEIGNFERGNRFIRNVGYYWAMSEYWDLETSLDFYENSRTILNSLARYNLRYKFSGNIGLNYSRETKWNRTNYRQDFRHSWRMSFSHNQTISPTATLAGSGQFVSDKNFVSQNIYNPADRLNRTISSNLSFNKSWPSRSISLSVTARQNWNLDTDVKSEVLPSIDISRQSLPIFAEPSKSKKKMRIRPNEIVEVPRARFYHSLQFSIRSSAQNFRQRSRLPDSTFIRRDYQTITTQSSISSPQRILGFLTVTPGLNFTHSLARLEPGRLPDSLGLAAGKFVTRQTYSTSISARTSIYGTVYPNIYDVLGIRHVVSPSVSYSYTPTVMKNQGYFVYTGGGGGSRRSRLMRYSLDNLFQAKLKAGDAEKKLDLFILGFSSSYNFAADSLKLNDLSTSLRTSAIPNVEISYNTLHSFYNINSAVRRPLWQPRLLTMTISSSIRGGYHPAGEKKSESDQKPGDDNARRAAFGPRPGARQEFTGIGVDFTVSHSYTETRTAGKPQKSQWINLSSQLQPTKNWRISYDCRYNMVNKRIEGQSFNIGRDLHCWEATFTWIPSGMVAGYYVRINIKSLPDIKVEKSEGGLRGGSYY